MRLPSTECITNGCNNRITMVSYWSICIKCYENTPEHIPVDQINLYNELKAEKENNEISNDM
jgi:hypothetical protein